MKRLGALALVGILLAAVLAFDAFRRDRDYSRLLTAGDRALARGETVVAIEAFSGAIALKPDSMLAYLRRGQTYRRRGELTAALRDLRTAVALDPAATHPRGQIGDVNYALGRFARAADHYEAYLRLDDRSSRTLYKLALTRYWQGQREAALRALRRAVTIDDRFAEAYYLIGMCERETDPAAAAAALEQALAIQPALLEAREQLADLHRDAGRAAAELAELESLVAFEPESMARRIALAQALARHGDVNRAVMTLEEALERHSTGPDVRVALARIWLDAAAAGAPERASLARARAVLEPLAPDSLTSEGLVLLARVRLLERRPAAAEPLLRRAVRTSPTDPQAFWHLAQLATAAGRLQEAHDSLVQYAAMTRPQAPSARDRGLDARIADLATRIEGRRAAR